MPSQVADDPRLTLDKLRLWALLRIARGDGTGDPALDAQGFGTVAAPGRPSDQDIAQAAIRGDKQTVTEAEPSGLTAEMILGSPS